MILDARLANTPKWYARPPAGFNMRVPPEILRSVAFLERRNSGGHSRSMSPGGTAFVVSVPGSDPRLSGLEHLYAVTARHCIMAMRSEPHYLRVNAPGGGFLRIEIEGELEWTIHPAEPSRVDVAVIPFRADIPEVRPIPRSMFLTDPELRERYIGPGDEITITGLFARLSGSSRNMPIVRRGTLAMIPDEPIRAHMGDLSYKEIEAYLVEVRSTGGISGSPAFVRAPVGFDVKVHDRSGNPRLAKAHAQADYYLLGLVHGHWESAADEVNSYEMAPATEDEESINTGIAIVVPAKKILEVLDHPDLVAMREAEERRRIDEGGSTTQD